MNDELNSQEIQWLDRLVDGELSARERQLLLDRLDETPDGWRRCGLAFLEAQAWQADLAPVGREQPRVAPSPRGRAPLRVFAVALAASILLAFGVGWQCGGRWAEDRLAQRKAPRGDGPRDIIPHTEGDEEYAGAGAPLQEADLAASGVSDSDPRSPVWQTVKLGVHDRSGSAVRHVDLPVMEARQLDPDWLNRQRPTVSAELRGALEQSGGRIQEQPQLLPITLDDGRQLVLPIDQVQISYAGSYQ
jgi:hypothetical protein